MAKSAAAPRTPAKRRARPVKAGAPAAPEIVASVNGHPSDEEVRVRAYHRYLERGATHGSDLDDWIEAEKDLKKP